MRFEIIRKIVEEAKSKITKMKNLEKCFPCPCCGYLTVSEPPPGTFEICPICNWEDDEVQFENIDYEGGANTQSLRTARLNFKEFGAASLRFLSEVRKPEFDEIP